MKSVPINELKRNLAAWIDEAAAGERVVVTRHNRAIATLVPAAMEGLHVGARDGQGSIRPLGVKVSGRSVLEVLAEDRSDDR